MTLFFESTVAFTVLITALETYLRARQHALFAVTTLPREVSGLVAQDKFLKAQAYGAAKSRFAFVTTAFELALTLAVLLGGLMPRVWALSLDVAEAIGLDASGEITRSLLYLVLFESVSSVLHVPFSLYSTFVIEEQFGFNKTTLRLWIVDFFKTAALQIVLGLPAVAGLLAVLRWAGESTAFYGWLASFVLILIFMTLFPLVIQPLFNKFTPLEPGELRTRIEQLATRVHFPLSKIYTIDASARSAHGNAYFFGIFKKQIVIYDTLLKQTDIDGVVAIVGHELGHFAHSHVLWNMIIVQAYMAAFFTLFQLSQSPALFAAFGFAGERPILIGLLLFSNIFAPASKVFEFGMHILSRHFEYQADEFALNLGLSLEAPLTKIYEENASALVVDPWWSTYTYSHPTLVERLAAMRAWRANNKKRN